jgi:hypothetical protein
MSTDLEIKLLKETILALREEMEKMRFDEQEHVQHAVAGSTEEIRQLRASIAELRDCLEQREAEHDETLRSVQLHHDRETADLRKTIATLRDNLEELNESLKKAGGLPQTSASASR